jgi:hypothetical protein
VTRSRASKRFDPREVGASLRSLAAAAALLGCGAAAVQPRASEPPVFSALAAQAEAPPRRPDGVVLEPSPALPSVAARGPSGGVLALRVPMGSDAVADVVRLFIDAWQRESIDALASLLTPDAGPIEARGRGSRALVEGWRQRLRAHGYARLAGVEVVRPDRIERWEAEELGVSGAPARPPDMRPGELLVRAAVEVPVVSGERLFGDQIVMIVRPDEGRIKIAAYGETDAR